MTIIWAVLDVAGVVVYVAWTLSGWELKFAHGRGRAPKKLFHTVYCELRPFYWPAVVAMAAGEIVDNPIAYALNWLHYLYAFSYFMNWCWLKDADDDDRWKRRRRRAAEAVKSIGARLIVVPVPQGAS